jgi:hypothetical protein
MSESTDRLEVLKSALESARDTIKAALLINSGAAIALLAFVGHVVTKSGTEHDPLAQALLPSLLWFVWGAVAGIFAHALSYAANLFFYRGKKSSADGFRIIGVVLTIVSIILFVIGCYSAYKTFSSYKPLPVRTGPTIQGIK